MICWCPQEQTRRREKGPWCIPIINTEALLTLKAVERILNGPLMGSILCETSFTSFNSFINLTLIKVWWNNEEIIKWRQGSSTSGLSSQLSDMGLPQVVDKLNMPVGSSADSLGGSSSDDGSLSNGNGVQRYISSFPVSITIKLVYFPCCI